MRPMMRNVVVRKPLAKKARIPQEVDVFTPVAIGELVPRPANLLAHLCEAFCRRDGTEHLCAVLLQTLIRVEPAP